MSFDLSHFLTAAKSDGESVLQFFGRIWSKIAPQAEQVATDQLVASLEGFVRGYLGSGPLDDEVNSWIQAGGAFLLKKIQAATAPAPAAPPSP